MLIAFRYLRLNSTILDLLGDLKEFNDLYELFWASVKELAYPPTYPADITKYLIIREAVRSVKKLRASNPMKGYARSSKADEGSSPTGIP